MGVGKTCLLKRLMKEALPPKMIPTVGVEYANKVFELKSGGRMHIQIWDTAGQEKYKAICMNQYRGSQGALLLFDLTKRDTFLACKQWLADYRMNGEEDAKVMLVGNKLDLIEMNPDYPELRKVSSVEAQNFADENDVLYMEASAIKDQNVYEALEKLLVEVYHSVNPRNPLEIEGTQLQSKKINSDQKDEDTPCCGT